MQFEKKIVKSKRHKSTEILTLLMLRDFHEIFVLLLLDLLLQRPFQPFSGELVASVPRCLAHISFFSIFHSSENLEG